MQIVYVSDGKAGHRSQALGLFGAIKRKVPHAQLQELPLDQLPVLSLIYALWTHRLSYLEHAPDYIVGVGSHTHLRVWLLGKIYPKAKTIILMKPSLPISCFDYTVVPAHDGVAASPHVLVTQGALNPLQNEQRHVTGRILIALGGSSKRHQWNEAQVLKAIGQIVQQHPQSSVILTTSRRTPENFLAHLGQKSYAARLDIYPVEHTPQGWIFEQMQLADTVYVTEDSVSMIFEAQTAGCRVGVIAIDRLKSDRITHMIDQLAHDQITDVIRLLHHAAPLSEADRVASQILGLSSS
ncbi:MULTISPECIES: ELM1/GtrOC1 family putative glycosyltransferase [Acinetobacter]|uniref:ELM1/GtrOC1 family putative glycosyltransferase n=1 Tax=Acinetobacter TaxID=469 RepID=UPI00202703B3|nr:ELM1/GtrOC1 family putative glycosyltransferase [Acinetobacter sp. ACZLY 512]MCL9675690.1 mitochondrial fission ELM1 family protein [Acinetobacter sp. ACZLY 512]